VPGGLLHSYIAKEGFMKLISTSWRGTLIVLRYRNGRLHIMDIFLTLYHYRRCYGCCCRQGRCA